MAPDGNQLFQLGPNLSIKFQTAPILFKFVQMVRNGSKYVRIGANRSKLVQIFQKGKNVSKWDYLVIIGPNGFKWVGMGSNGSKWVNIGSNRLKFIKLV